MWSTGGVVSADLTTKTVEVIAPSEPVRSGSFHAADVPIGERGGLKDRFFTEILPRETVQVADANAIAAEHDDLISAIREGHEPLVPAAAGAAAVEVAARVLEVLECTPFGGGRPAGRDRPVTIPLFPHRKTG
jgi:hypothetical protein